MCSQREVSETPRQPPTTASGMPVRLTTEVFAVRILDAYEPGDLKVRNHDGVNLL